MAASVATRQFLVHLASDRRAQFIPSLSPAMCLNRCGAPHGVAVLPWRLAAGTMLPRELSFTHRRRGAW